MAHLDPQEAFEHLSGKVVESIKQQFPIKGRLRTLHLENIEVRDNLHPNDIRSQQKAKTGGTTWAVPVYGTFVLKDNATGKVIDKRSVRITDIPKMTTRYSYIIGGQEYQMDSQWQLKPGAYARRRQNGQLEVQFNAVGPGSKSFDMLFDPSKRLFHIEWNKAKLPAYPILSAMGVSDEQLQKAWGKDILEANKSARGVEGTLANAFRSDKGRNPNSIEEAKEYLWATMQASKMQPDVTARTLGKPHGEVNGEALLSASKRILDMHQGGPEDDRDSLVFKRLRTTGDFVQDKIRGNSWAIKQKMLRKVDSAESIRDVVKTEHFTEPIAQTFYKNQAARVAKQINPLEMMSAAMQTTVRGVGGIQSEHGIVDETKFINPSQFGFLDPINTPEGPTTGVSLRLPLGVRKIGEDPHVPLYNLRTHKMELLPPAKVLEANLLLPDQVRWVNGKPVPISDKVKILGKGNELQIGSFKDAQYVMRHPSQVFNITSNLIPFLHSDQGNRAGMAARHMEQAISLLHREQPLVQVATGAETGYKTFEQMVGHHTSHLAPVDGKVTRIERDRIIIQSGDGKKHEVQLYDHYPLNDPKAFLHSSPTVKVGDTVKRGQHVADTNYTKNGVLSLGTNLRVAYMPYKGYNFDDGIVISESAAKKMSSVHMAKPSLTIDEKMSFDPKRFRVLHPGTFKTEQLEKIGPDGIVRVGTIVKPGDPLVLATVPFQLHDRVGIAAIRKNTLGVHTDKSLRWDSEHEGEVVAAYKKGDKIYVHVKTVEPMTVGDKLAGRHGNKGICAAILPDDQMPRTKDGKHIEVLLNPIGVPGRINVGQIFETVASKIALKTGKPYLIKNFEPGRDQIEAIKKEAKAHGVDGTDELFDPITGHSLGHVQTGYQYMLKEVHQIEKKSAVRGGMTIPGSRPEHYDQNLVPSGGGHAGGQSIGALGLYALLAHGAKANIREMQTWKSEGEDPQTSEEKRWKGQHNMVWKALQTGGPLPTPQPTFAFKKFTDYMKAAGINMEKKGHLFVLSPLTDAQIKTMSSGAIPHPDRKVSYKLNEKREPVPIKGGLFDEDITGGHGGTKWSHIDLAEPVPNPVFEAPIKSLTGLTQKQYNDVIAGRLAVTPRGELTENTKMGVIGGHGIELLLKKIDVDQHLKQAKAELAAAPAAKVDAALKKVKYLEALKKVNLKPHEAYVLHHLPVLPPVMRPISVLPNGSLNEADINELYSKFGQLNKQLLDPTVSKEMTDNMKKGLREQYYDGVRAIMGVGVPYANQKEKGILHQLAGPVPKEGYFQRTLMNRRQDLTMRSTIIPEPALGLDEVGIPKHFAMDLFRPFVVRQLVQMGAPHVLAAQEMIAKNDPLAHKALERVAEDHPVLLKRDPALHKYSVMGFKPKLVEGSAIRVHPLVTSGFNADFDGDTMSVYVPISDDAKAEARRMMPSNNLFANASGRVMFQPKLESGLGIYKLSRVTGDSGKKFSNPGEAVAAAKAGKINVTELVHVPGVGKTTAGRIMLAATLPKPLQDKVLTDHKLLLDKKGLGSLLTDMARMSIQEGPYKNTYGKHVNMLKDVGNWAATGLAPVVTNSQSVTNSLDPKNQVLVPMGAHTLGLADLEPDRAVRDAVLKQAQRKVKQIEASNLPHAEKERRIVDVWTQADRDMQAAHKMKVEASGKPSNLYMLRAIGKPSDDQYKQLVLAPMLVKDTSGRVVPHPITKSFAEGQDISDYWIGMYGARRGAVRKVQEVQEPGVITKMMQNTAMDMLVTNHDCGTDKGIAMSVTDKAIHDRHLAAPFQAGNLKLAAGTLLTPDIVGQIRAVKKDAQLLVRSPLKCQEEHGVCQKCMGLAADGKHYPIGYNVGVESAHAHGEKTTQLMLNSFHCMHEHSIVLVKEGGVVMHTTLGELHKRYGDAPVESQLFVWDRDKWSRVLKVTAHAQHTGTTMVMCRTRSGHFIVSQGNHPHMLRANLAVCPKCSTYPKKSNGGRQYYCRKCGHAWQGIVSDDSMVQMTTPEEINARTHRAIVSDGPTPTPSEPPVSMPPWLIGMYCAEGSVHRMTHRGYNDEPVGVVWSQTSGTPIYDRMAKQIGEYAEHNGLHAAQNSGQVHIYSVELGRLFLRLFGSYSSDRGLPEGWSGYAPQWLLDFVSGVMDGDGTFVRNRNSRWVSARIDTTSVLLAQQLHYILRSNGVPAKVIATALHKNSMHQGLAVQFVVTEQVKRLLSSSIKIQGVEHAKPKANEERFSDVVDYVVPFFFHSPPVVYDLTTETGTLSVDGFWTHNTGGVAGTTKGAGDEFEQFENLLKLPKTIPNQATIAMKGGKIESIRHDKLGAWITIGGHEHFVGKDRAGMGLHEDLPYASKQPGYKPWQPPRVGMVVQPGQYLSDPNRTTINPRELYEATGSIEAVQHHLANEIHSIFGKEGVGRRQSELLVRAMTNTTKIQDPGDHPHLLRGEYHDINWVKQQNALLRQQGKRPIVHAPELKGIDVLPLYMRDDWMAKLQHQDLRDTILDAAATGAVSNLHGVHPVPGIAYGAEFGITRREGLRPGMERFRNVPEHHY